jgi:hypothetical protein
VVEDIPCAAPARELDAGAAPGIEVIVSGGRRVVVRPGRFRTALRAPSSRLTLDLRRLQAALPT